MAKTDLCGLPLGFILTLEVHGHSLFSSGLILAYDNPSDPTCLQVLEVRSTLLFIQQSASYSTKRCSFLHVGYSLSARMNVELIMA